MEHPSLNITDLSELRLDELQEKITELTRKLNFAYQTNNQSLISQIGMALESYNSARDIKLNDMFPKDNGNDYKDKIDIS